MLLIVFPSNSDLRYAECDITKLQHSQKAGSNAQTQLSSYLTCKYNGQIKNIDVNNFSIYYGRCTNVEYLFCAVAYLNPIFNIKYRSGHYRLYTQYIQKATLERNYISNGTFCKGIGVQAGGRGGGSSPPPPTD